MDDRWDRARLLVTVEEAADLLSLGRTLVYQLVTAGTIESIHIGRARRIPVASLQRFIAEKIDDTGREPEGNP